jgi:hypothetical protein
VPKIGINENCDFLSSEYNVRLSDNCCYIFCKIDPGLSEFIPNGLAQAWSLVNESLSFGYCALWEKEYP